MKVKELIEQLQKITKGDDIVITPMDDNVFIENFEVHSPYVDGQAQEIILPIYIEKYTME